MNVDLWSKWENKFRVKYIKLTKHTSSQLGKDRLIISKNCYRGKFKMADDVFVLFMRKFNQIQLKSNFKCMPCVYRLDE